MRQALFGGSFDPLHNGHLAMIRAVLARDLADGVLVVPAGRNPLKGKACAPAADRLRMAELGTAGLAGVRVLDVEACRSGPSFTADTLETLTRDSPGDRFFVMIGGDNLAEFSAWQRPERILALARLLVFPRGGEAALPPALAGRAEVVTGFADPVSATEVRALLAAGARPVDLLPAAVLDYIEARGLYRAAGRPAVPPPGGEARGRCR
jgi:nicotinate-nucleotide adenylyltransferase